ncbi:DUF3093 domain-containing protein [Saccharopolyspora sp. SCSIO 74807]|uniref:DUF3093 domain-containing protein n=1 Tax=Saccharopolyspora sp. SCSIO 74807 TaxID=3118084 RepID=UPI0030D56B02
MSESAEAATPRQDTPGQGNPEGGNAEAGSTERGNAERGSGGEPAEYRERLFASWWTWPLPLIIAVLLAAEVHMGHPGVRAWLPYVVLIPAAIAVPLWLGRTRVEISGGELWVGDAHLPLRFIEGAEVVPAKDKRRALGPELDPAAFVVHRPWVKSSVRVWLDDPDDPTPYWVISSRRPERLAAALRR